MKLKLLLHQTEIHSYRANLWINLSKLVNILPITDSYNLNALTKTQIREFKLLDKQLNNYSYIGKNNSFQIIKKALLEDYDIFFCALDSKRFDLLISGCIALIRKKKFIFQSHCLHKSRNIHNPIKLIIIIFINYVWFILATRVIAYGDKSRSFFYMNETNKIKILHNRYESMPNNSTRLNKDIENIVKDNVINILFIGRKISRKSFLFFIEIKKIMKKEFSISIEFHLITESKFHESHDFFNYYGPIRDNKLINEISEKCIFGINPESIGLSYIHYMCLGLIPIINNNLYMHGPEVIDNFDSNNTVFYKYNDAAECCYEINNLHRNLIELKKKAIHNFEIAKYLHKKKLSLQLYELMIL